MEEMCVNYIHYYPRTQLELCKTHVDPGYLQKYFNFMNRWLIYSQTFPLAKKMSTFVLHNSLIAKPPLSAVSVTKQSLFSAFITPSISEGANAVITYFNLLRHMLCPLN